MRSAPRTLGRRAIVGNFIALVLALCCGLGLARADAGSGPGEIGGHLAFTAGNDAVCRPALPSFSDELGIDSEDDDHPSRLDDAPCHGLPDLRSSASRARSHRPGVHRFDPFNCEVLRT